VTLDRAGAACHAPRVVRVAAIVPAYNEARNLPRLAEALRGRAPACDVCVVDDGSTDGTAEVAGSLGWTVLRLPMNLGIGGAVQVGYLWAFERGYDVAVQVDGDAQHDPAYLEALLAPIADGRADLVVGSRFLSDGGFKSTRVRRAGIRYLSWLLRLRCRARVTDPTSGFRAAGRKAIELFARYYPSDYPEPEAIALASRAGLRLAEVPVRMQERPHGRSSITAMRSVYYLVKVSLALVVLPPRSEPLEGGTA
jgi:glycosyltransferase involved in cell wall biosynthesis